MNMFAQERRKSAPAPAPLKLPILDFAPKRAGRAVADIQGLKVTASEICAHTVYFGKELSHRVLGGYVKVQRRTWAERKPAALLVRGSLADVEAVPSIDDDDVEADLVRWFIEGQAEAEKAMRIQAPADQDPDPPAEPILALRDDPHAQSWRGGGTMHRR